MRRAALAPVRRRACASALGAQPSPFPDPGGGAALTPRQPSVFRSATQLVPLNVTVIGVDDQFVRGLTADDFLVLEDGVRQDVRFFDTSDVPLDLIILLDTSASMSDKMGVVHQAAAGFLDTLRPGDRGAVVAFNDGVDIVHTLTDDAAALKGAVGRTRARGATSLHNALYIALKQFGLGSRSAAAEVRRQAIAVLSDGEDTSSLVSFDDVLATARTSGVSIYPIGLRSRFTAAQAALSGRRQFSQSEYSLRKLAQETGGQAFFPKAPVELADVYAAIARELASQYSIAYTPSNTAGDGRYRRIVVKVESRPELRLRTRTGYTMEPRRAEYSSTAGRAR